MTLDKVDYNSVGCGTEQLRLQVAGIVKSLAKKGTHKEPTRGSWGYAIEPNLTKR
jgi:hypothetical protein